MKAVALTRYLAIDDPQSLVDVDLPDPPAPTGHDLLVRVEAVSVNPVDTKVRSPKPQVGAQPNEPGYDAVRIVRESGLPNRTDAMFTTLDGEWDECMDVVRRATEAVGRHGTHCRV